MKKIFFSTLFVLLAGVLLAQPTFDLGIKAGFNNSKISIDLDDYNSESIQKAHFGAFGRLGWGRIFVQPEAYFSSKGGDLSSDVLSTATSFNYNSVDVPVLLGFKIIKGGVVDLHLNAGPVFSFLTSQDVDGDFTDELDDNYIGVQYGLGIDIWFLTFDARMEHGSDKLFSNYSEFSGNTNMFMLSLGFKIL